MDKKNFLDFINKQSFVSSKKMGQNFLHSSVIKEKIVNAANLRSDDFVIEIGPGLGAISEIILKSKCKLLSIELDKRLYEYLTKNLLVKYKNFNIINDDVLKIDFDNIIHSYGYDSAIMIANLPYSISSKIILKILFSKTIEKCIIMVQKEMAQRLCAKVNSSDYNAFSSLVSLFADVKFLFDVSPNNFIPVPKVNSSVIKLTNLHNKIDVDIKLFNKFLRLCFQNRRKTLINNLQIKYTKSKIIDFLKNNGYSLTIRAQELNVNELLKIYKALENYEN